MARGAVCLCTQVQRRYQGGTTGGLDPLIVEVQKSSVPVGARDAACYCGTSRAVLACIGS